MGQNSHQAFHLSRSITCRAQRRPQTALGLRNGAFHVPAMSVQASLKPALHLPAIAALGPFAASPHVEGNDRGTDVQFLASEAVVVLGVIRGVGQQSVDGQSTARLPQGLGKVHRVLSGTLSDYGRGEQVRCGMTDDGELGPALLPKAMIPHAVQIVPRNVAVLQTGRVDDRFGPFVDQATRSRSVENGGEEGIESPFFRSRSWAYLSVE